MRVLEPGKPQAGWSRTAACAAQDGCGALLQIDAADVVIRYKGGNAWENGEPVAAFRCPQCGLPSEVKVPRDVFDAAIQRKRAEEEAERVAGCKRAEEDRARRNGPATPAITITVPRLGRVCCTCLATGEDANVMALNFDATGQGVPHNGTAVSLCVRCRTLTREALEAEALPRSGVLG